MGAALRDIPLEAETDALVREYLPAESSTA